MTQRGQSPTYAARLTVWRRDLDLPKFDSPVERLKYPSQLLPTLESEEFELNQTLAEELLARFHDISISPIPRRFSGGLDATLYELAFGHDRIGGGRLNWCDEPPDEWQALGTAFAEVVAMLNQAFRSG
jgi:hypothetical protein